MSSIMDDVIHQNAKELAINALGSLVDEFHANARGITFAPAREALREAADLISEARKELQRG
jgi:predicted RNase H-like HicB family nuclease